MCIIMLIKKTLILEKIIIFKFLGNENYLINFF